MESYLVDVSKLRIPRPKFASFTSSQATGATGKCRPGPRAEPPRDYNMDDDYNTGSSSSITTERGLKSLRADTEDIRQEIQEKL